MEVSNDPTEVDQRVRAPTAPTRTSANVPVPTAISGIYYGRGDSIGRYLVLETLGQGAMGTVYGAFDPGLDRKVALKLLRPGGSSVESNRRAKAQRRLEREARALAKLSHPNVVQVYEAGVNERAPTNIEQGIGGGTDNTNDGAEFEVFVAMEYVEGMSVKEWQRNDLRPHWRDILRVYIDACRGLAAAHEAGLVHRDIKPANILLGRDQRVRVVDFGLATVLDPNSTGRGLEPTHSNAPENTVEHGSELSQEQRMARVDQLTRTGTIMGTPAYMAPEQHLGVEAGPAADQYALCAALYEALYEVRPFTRSNSADPFEALFGVKRDGHITEPPPTNDTPRWLVSILRRGLAPEPEDRYSSMHELIAALEDDPQAKRRSRWRRFGVSLALLSAVAVTIFGWLSRPAAIDPCTDIGDLLTGVWDQGVRERMQSAFVASGVVYAPDTAERIITRLDAYADEWTQMRESQCRAPDDELKVERVLCMSQRRNRLAALTNVLGGAAVNVVDTKTVNNAVKAVANLPLLVDCSDEEYLSASVPPPDDPVLRQRVESLQPRVDRLQALDEAGQYQDGVVEGETLLAELTDDEYPPLLAEALYRTARLKARTGDYPDAEKLLEKSIRAATQGKDDVAAARGWGLLLFVVGYHQQRIEDAKPLIEWANVYAERIDADEVRAFIWNSIGTALYGQGDPAGSLSYYRRALALREQSFGPSHPNVAMNLNNIASVLYKQGKYAESLTHHRRALAIWEESLGPDHTDIALGLNNIGVALGDQGEYTDALSHHQRALDIREKALGPDHPEIAMSLSNIGLVLGMQGDHAAAIEPFRQALAICEKAFGPDHPYVAYPLSGLGSAFLMLGSLDEASVHLERAREIREKAFGPDHPEMAGTFLSLGELALAQNQWQRAIDLVEHAISLNGTSLPGLHFVLAKALWIRNQPGDRTRAFLAATKARDAYAAIPNPSDRDEVDAWLSQHQRPSVASSTSLN